MEVFLIIILLSFVAFGIHLFISKKKKTFGRVVELLLLYQLIFYIGVLGVLSFIALTFYPEYVAKFIRWPVCPFQQELGNANLGFAVLGFLSIWFRGHFWTAIVIGASVWLFADGIGHAIDAYYFGNTSEGNTGALLYTDLLFPLFLVALLTLYWQTKKLRVK